MIKAIFGLCIVYAVEKDVCRIRSYSYFDVEFVTSIASSKNLSMSVLDWIDLYILNVF